MLRKYHITHPIFVQNRLKEKKWQLLFIDIIMSRMFVSIQNLIKKYSILPHWSSASSSQSFTHFSKPQSTYQKDEPVGVVRVDLASQTEDAIQESWASQQSFSLSYSWSHCFASPPQYPPTDLGQSCNRKIRRNYGRNIRITISSTVSVRYNINLLHHLTNTRPSMNYLLPRKFLLHG